MPRPKLSRLPEKPEPSPVSALFVIDDNFVDGRIALEQLAGCGSANKRDFRVRNPGFQSSEHRERQDSVTQKAGLKNENVFHGSAQRRLCGQDL